MRKNKIDYSKLKDSLLDKVASLASDLVGDNQAKAIKTIQKGFNSDTGEVETHEDKNSMFELPDFIKFIAIRLNLNKQGVTSLRQFEEEKAPSDTEKLKFEVAVLEDIYSMIEDLLQNGATSRSIQNDLKHNTPFTWSVDLINEAPEYQA
jgi:hypothetical protein